MSKKYEDMTKEELIVQLEGRDAKIDYVGHELKVAREALVNCADRSITDFPTPDRACSYSP
jgi:hypothetical protein